MRLGSVGVNQNSWGCVSPGEVCSQGWSSTNQNIYFIRSGELSLSERLMHQLYLLRRILVALGMGRVALERQYVDLVVDDEPTLFQLRQRHFYQVYVQ